MGKFHNTSRWRKLRALKLAQTPCCEICAMSGGRVSAAKEVHHLLPVDDFPEEATNMMYLQSLCSECHDQMGGNEWKKGVHR